MSVAGHSSHRSVESSFDRGAFPAPLTSFIGRAECCTELAELLGRHRLVTLTGSGGCGKTRLALKVATKVLSRFGDHGAFVDLSPVESNALVVNSVAAACGVSETGTAPLTELLLRQVAERRLLIVLDNCEHVVDECAPLVQQLLSRCAGVAVLATSREPLGVDGEVIYRVPPLNVPDDSHDREAALRASEAGQLFVDRAALARPEHRFTERDALAAISVCRRLEGVPLAIELAASRLRVLDPAALAEALAGHFEVLGEGPRTAPPRQRTLQASMDWSHELLDDRECRVFRRTGVFAGSFSAESAAAVCADTVVRADEVVMVLMELVDRSLVQVDTVVSGPRYRLLGPVRDYARARLAAAGEEPTTRDRHLDHYVGVAKAFGSGAATDATLERIDHALDDLRAAMDWGAQSGQVNKALRAAAALRGFWIGRGRTAEGRARLTGLLEADPGRDVRARASALAAAAEVAANLKSVRTLASEALDLSRSAGDRTLEAEALTLRGWTQTFCEPQAAIPLLEESLDLATEVGHDRFVESSQMGLGMALLNSGDLIRASGLLADAVQRARAPSGQSSWRQTRRQSGSWGLRFGLALYGCVETLRGRLERAETTLSEAAARPYDIYARFNDDLARQSLGLVHTLRGDYQKADSIHESALAGAAARGDLPIIALLHSAALDLACGSVARATSRAADALPAFRRMGWRWLEVQALRILGDAAALSGDHETAEASWREAAAAADSSGNPVAQTVAALGLARGAGVSGDAARARSEARRALRHALGAEYRIGAIDALEALAVLGASADVTTSRTAEDAVRLLAAVDAERARVGYVRFPVDRPRFEHAVAPARATLGADFESAWAQGSALPFDDAVAMASRGERRPPRPPSGWASLTPAELRVARLVGNGLTNRQIGERLFISARTVQTHLSRVFAKLSVSGRAELATAISHRDSAADSVT